MEEAEAVRLKAELEAAAEGAARVKAEEAAEAQEAAEAEAEAEAAQAEEAAEAAAAEAEAEAEAAAAAAEAATAAAEASPVAVEEAAAAASDTCSMRAEADQFFARGDVPAPYLTLLSPPCISAAVLLNSSAPPFSNRVHRCCSLSSLLTSQLSYISQACAVCYTLPSSISFSFALLTCIDATN